MSTAQRPWYAELGARIRGHLFLTLTGTTAVVFMFLIGYFHTQRYPAFPLTVMPLLSLDRLIPFQPLALLPYLSLWVYVGVGPALQRTRAELLVYGLWTGALCLTGLAFFYFLPTQVPPSMIELGSGSAARALLHRVDAAGNACPSMHVAAAVFTAIRVQEVLRWARSPKPLRLLNVGFCALICYSTLAVKQHVVLDVVAGAVLGSIFTAMSLYWRPGVPVVEVARSARVEDASR